MKLTLTKSIVNLIILYCFVTVNSEKTSATVFDFLNNMFETAPIQPLKEFRFMGTKANNNDTSLNKETTTSSADGAIDTTPKVNPSLSANSKLTYVDLNDPNMQLSEWMTISSPSFASRNKYPQVMSPDGSQALIDLSNFERVNANYAVAKTEGANISTAFWFKVRGGYIYYSSTKQDINVLDAIFVKEVQDNKEKAAISNNEQTCFDVKDYDQNNWKICSTSKKTKSLWLCSLKKYLNQNLDQYCIPPEERKAQVTLIPPTPTVEFHTIVQNVIVIPMASKACNDKWSYLNKGADWQCTCKEGLEQSPIDLPSKDQATLSPLKPLFQYNLVSANSDDSTYDGILTAGQPVKIRYEKEAIRIFHSNMGKIVALDGGVYVAEEISFHTPSEHKIDGKVFNMEMQIVHTGRTKGDIAKQIIVSFLFKKTPGVYNKLIDKLDFFNLPNPVDTYRDIANDFFIPSVFSKSDEDDLPTMQPFSFYTYQGSLTIPPCTERTTHYVVADPLPLSNTVITLFMEALKQPETDNTEMSELLVNDEGDIENNRDLQPLNNRKVFLFDHRHYGCVDYVPKKKHIQPSGHYEKVDKEATEYIYVNGKTPSGIPDSFVVSEEEAKGSTI